MKNIITLMLLTLTFSAFACPDLEGTYRCSETLANGQVTPLTLMIVQNGDEFSISLNDEVSDTFMADGVSRDFSLGFIDAQKKASCSNEKLTLVISAEFGSGADKTKLKSSTEFFKIGNKLYQQLTASHNGSAVTKKSVCTQL